MANLDPENDPGIERRRSAQAARLFALGVLAVSGCPDLALGDDNDAVDDKSKLPNIYLDLNTVYTSVPPNTFAIGLRNFVLPTAGSAQAVTMNAPLTVDLSDRVSVYGGVSASIYKTDFTSWTAVTLDSWNVGFSADIIQRSGSIPTVTVQSTLTRSITSAPGLASTATTTIVELDYALDDDETRGLLAGTRLATVNIDSGLVKVQPAWTGYVGGYYQWPNNWKAIARVGIQTFGGAHLGGGALVGNLLPVKSFTQPTLRLDLDRMDDNDNRLFGASLEIAWTPQPIVQMTLRTPLYAVRN